jgi:hypothetical protein
LKTAAARDSGAMAAAAVTHNLYVFTPGTAPADKTKRDQTLAVLKYVDSHTSIFKRMGVVVQVHKVRKSDLENPRLIEAMKRQGIRSLPALLTPNAVYVGLQAIFGIYAANIEKFRQATQTPDDDPLAEHHRLIMAGGGPDSDEDAMGAGGGGSDMMGAYQKALEQRIRHEKQHAGGSAGADRQPLALDRPDNMALASPASARDPELDALIEKMGNSTYAVDDKKRILAASGGDSFDDNGGGGGDAQDDYMAAHYWANQEDSSLL